MIAGMAALSRLTGLELGQPRPQLLPILGEFGLYLWGVLHVAMPRDDLPIRSHDGLFVVFDILDSGLDIVRRETEEASNLLITPTLLPVIHYVIHRDTGTNHVIIPFTNLGSEADLLPHWTRG
jgi:hypothetical protein